MVYAADVIPLKGNYRRRVLMATRGNRRESALWLGNQPGATGSPGMDARRSRQAGSSGLRSRCRRIQEFVNIAFVDQGNTGVDEGRDRRRCIRSPVSRQGL